MAVVDDGGGPGVDGRLERGWAARADDCFAWPGGPPEPSRAEEVEKIGD